MEHLMQLPLVKGLVSGMLAALVVDLNAYLAYLKDPLTPSPPYNVRIALARVILGAVSGAITALGLGAL